MPSFIITEESHDRTLGHDRQAAAVLVCITDSASTQPVVHVRKDGTRLITNGEQGLYGVTRNGNIFADLTVEEHASEAEETILARYADAAAAFSLAA